MSYCDYLDLVVAFGETEVLQLTDRDRDDSADTSYVSQLISDVDAEINSYLRVRYSLPLSSIPQRLKAIACDFVRYRAYTFDPPEIVIARYKDGMAYLRDVAAGRAQLDLAELPEAALDNGSPDWVAINRLFSAETLEGF